MTNESITDKYRRARDAIAGLRTACLEPRDIAEIVLWSKEVNARVSAMQTECLEYVSTQLMTDDGEETSK